MKCMWASGTGALLIRDHAQSGWRAEGQLLLFPWGASQGFLCGGPEGAKVRMSWSHRDPAPWSGQGPQAAGRATLGRRVELC